MYYEGALYWGGVSGNARTVKPENGLFLDDSLKTVDCGVKCYGTPVAANGRVYVAGMEVNTSVVNAAPIAVCVLDDERMELIYNAWGNESGKIQSTPILCNMGESARIYVQGYKQPGTVYFLEDDASKTSGSLTALLEPVQSQYAWDQLACDSEGALYCTNNAGYLMKYQSQKASVIITGGDVNGDGKVNISDAVILSRYLADWDVTIVEANSDLNGDGICDVRDLVMLRRHLAGWYD